MGFVGHGFNRSMDIEHVIGDFDSVPLLVGIYKFSRPLGNTSYISVACPPLLSKFASVLRINLN